MSRSAETERQLSFWEAAAPATPAPKKLSKAAVTKLVTKVSPDVSSAVGNEIITGQLSPATWALALAYSNGSHDQAITHYARLRLEELADSNAFSRKKEQALEARRRAGFKKIRTPLPKLYLQDPTPVGHRNRRRTNLSPVWLAGLWLGITSACAAITRFYSEKFDDPTGRLTISGSLGVAALTICAVIIIHQVLPKSRRILRYAIPLSAWAAPSTSCYFGLMILKARFETPPTAVNNRSHRELEILQPIHTSGVQTHPTNLPSKALAQSRYLPVDVPASFRSN